MPTLEQLRAESWWGREIVTPQLDWLGDEMCRRTGRPRTAAGSKGNAAHLRGAHRSQEWISHSRYCTSRTYTVQPGLSADQARHIAGFDFTPGDVDDMIAQSRRLMAEVKAGRLEEVREIFCNVDGDQVVDGWDNVRNRAATSDSSHLWHWHLTLDRRRMHDQTLMERIVRVALALPAPPPKEEDDVSTIVLFTSGGRRWRGDGVTRAPITAADESALRYIAGRTGVKLHDWGSGEVANPDAFGVPASVADVDEQAIATALAPLLQTGVTLDQLREVLAGTRLAPGA